MSFRRREDPFPGLLLLNACGQGDEWYTMLCQLGGLRKLRGSVEIELRSLRPGAIGWETAGYLHGLGPAP